MSLGLAGGARSALANAGIHTLVVDARLIVGALVVAQALTTRAVRQWIAGVAWQAVADWSLTSCIVMTGDAERICAARIWFAEILLRERTTAHKRIAGHVAWAAADRCQTAQITVSAHTACAITCVLADAIEAGRTIGWTIGVAIALGTTLGVRRADVTLGAFADGTVTSDCVAGGADAALLASGHTLVVAAGIACAAVAVVFALVTTAAKWIASEAMYTRTGGHAI